MFASSQEKNKKRVQEVKRKIKKAGRENDRQIKNLERVCNQTKINIKKHLSNKNRQAATVLAKQHVSTQKQLDSLINRSAQFTVIISKMETLTHINTITQCTKSATTALKTVNRMMDSPDQINSLRDLSIELNKAELIEETLDDAFSIMEEPNLEDEADDEIDNILEEMNQELLDKTPKLRKHDSVVVRENQDVDIEKELLKLAK